MYIPITIHEFGKENTELILLIHPSVVKWDYFENVIPLLEKKYHLLVPALPGYDFGNDSDFTSVEQIASDLNVWMKAQGYIALKDYLMMMIGRTGGVGLLEKAFATDEYTMEDLQYVAYL